MWAILNLFFLFTARSINLVYIGTLGFMGLAFALITASYFATEDVKMAEVTVCKKTGGVFPF